MLEDGVYYKFGETRERQATFRLVCATNSDLACADGSFRRDLFYRINGIAFYLPPLREHRDDIHLLVPIFIKEANYAYNKTVRGVTPRAMQRLVSYNWPGNIRELKWCINRAVAIAAGDVLDLDELFSHPSAEPFNARAAGLAIDYKVPFEIAVEELEKSYISHALQNSVTKTEAARMIGISLRVLHYKIKKYGL